MRSNLKHLMLPSQNEEVINTQTMHSDHRLQCIFVCCSCCSFPIFNFTIFLVTYLLFNIGVYEKQRSKREGVCIVLRDFNQRDVWC